MVAVVDLTDALEQGLVEGNLVLEVGEHRLHLFLNLAYRVGFVGFDDGKEYAADVVERLAALLEGQDGILEGGRVLILHYFGYFIAILLDGSLEGGQVVGRLYLAEVGSAEGQGALLQQWVLTLRLLAGGELHHRGRQYCCRDAEGHQFSVHSQHTLIICTRRHHRYSRRLRSDSRRFPLDGRSGTARSGRSPRSRRHERYSAGCSWRSRLG